jgi:AcrR family transcriptional regulator
MKDFFSQIKIEVNENLYLKDPESSDLGKRIVENSISLIDDVGFEQFNFKKLGNRIGSNESSIYRYFENKHKLLLYLASWYWSWKEYQLVFSTANIFDSKVKMQRAVQVLTRQVEKDLVISHIDEEILNRVVINEFSKSYLTKEVDKENKEGFFTVYNRLIHRLKEMILELNSDYPYPASLASTILEGSLHQHFLKEHFPSFTDCNEDILPSEFFTHLVLNILNLDKNG